MKKIISIISVFLVLMMLLPSCDIFVPDETTKEQECTVHQWSEYKHNGYVHWREYTCGCPWPEIVEEHFNNDGDLLCDICGFEMVEAKYDDNAVALAGEKMNVTYNDSIDEGYRAFLEKLNVFSAKLTAKIYERFGSGENISVSPISVYMALALVCECSDGETRNEVLRAVGVTYEEVNKYTKYLYAFCNQEHYAWNEQNEKMLSGYELLTNSIWLDDSVAFKNAGIEKLSKDYNCDVFQTDFGTDSAKEAIKSYINEKTKGLIDGNLPLDPYTAFVLLNTFYLNDAWSDLGDDLSFTKEEYAFENSDGTTVNKNLLMGYYSLGRAHNFGDYSVFYAQTSNGYRIHFLVPNSDNSVDVIFTQANIENVLSVNDWGGYDYENMVCYNTRVFFPEFEADFGEIINDVMIEDFEIATLFDETACNMNNVTDTQVFCSAIVHKSKLKVDKTGIEGAAITAAIMAGEAVDPFTYEYNDFVVDKAFAFILTDRYGTVLFSGAVNSIK